MSEIRSRVATDEYRQNHDRVFRSAKQRPRRTSSARAARLTAEQEHLKADWNREILEYRDIPTESGSV